MEDATPKWDQEAADGLIGRTVLIGLTMEQGDQVEQQQMFGRVISAEERIGISVSLEGSRQGEVYRLPPDPRNFYPAAKGEYRLRTTGEIVVDPDFTVTWTIENPA